MSDDIKIYGKLTNATTDNVLAGADQIYDSYQKKFQEDINKLIPKLESGKIPSKYLPSYVDDVLEGVLVDEGTFDVTNGEPYQTGVIYLDTTTNISYRWSGSKYVKISSPLELGTTEDTALKGSLGISSVMTSSSALGVEIFLFKYSGSSIKCLIPSATQTGPGVMSTADKTVVNNAKALINSHPLVGELSFAISNNKRYLLYTLNGNSTSTGIEVPQFGETLQVLADKTLTGSESCYIQLYGSNTSGDPISSVELPRVNEFHDGVLSSAKYLEFNNAASSIDGIYSSINELNNTVVTTVDIGYNSDSVDVNLLTQNSNPIESNIEAATVTKAGVMSATDKTKLDTLDWYFEE